MKVLFATTNPAKIRTYADKIHHRKENGTPDKSLLRQSIESMKSYL